MKHLKWWHPTLVQLEQAEKKHGSSSCCTVDLAWFHKDFTFAHLKCTVDPVNPSTQVEATCSMSGSKLGDLPGRVDVG